MDASFLPGLKAAVLVSPELSAVGRNDTELARLLNLPSTFVVWRSTTDADLIADAIVWANLTPADTADGTAVFTNRARVCQAKQINLQIMLQGRQLIPSGKLNFRQGLQDALLNVPAGVGGTLLDAGWLGNGKVKASISRFATVAEKIFATGTGTAPTPGNLVFDGLVSINDIGDMWNL